MLVEHEGSSFATQVDAESVEAAASGFFSHAMAKSLSPALTPADIIYITPMTDLVNMWAICAGRAGQYVTITAVLTQQPEAI
jgi:hypothetical protein